MTSSGEDSAEVVEFLMLFRRLKDWCDDSPEELVKHAKLDDSLSELCISVNWKGYFLKSNERRHRALFTAPVSESFRVAWREYEDRYESVLSQIWWAAIFPDDGIIEPSRVPKAEQQWRIADDEGVEHARAIEEAISLADEESSYEWREFAEGHRERVIEGITAWKKLKQETGFDLRGVFRRRALVPFVLVPRQVAARYGSAEKLSMLKNLQQAHDAFVYGATYGALALMRSIMEAVLRDHYAAQGKDLSEQIRNARGRLPQMANEAALHRLRKLANAILHLDREKDEGLPRMDDVRLEKEIVSLLFVLRALIEGAK